MLEDLEFNNFVVNKGDFLKWAIKSIGNTKIDAVIGNPPFIRYQYLDKEFQDNSKAIFDKLNLKFTKHTNSWVTFLLSCLSLLKDNGRIGMAIPAEILNVIHAKPLRDFIADGLYKVLIINPKYIWFDNTLQGVVIMFIEKVNCKSQTGLSILNVENDEFIDIDPETLFNSANYIDFDCLQDKWTDALLDENELALINRIKDHNSVHKFSDIATIEIGIVTGANEFFLVNDNTVKEYDLCDFAYPMLGKGQHCKGIIYDNDQHIENKENNFPTNFIYLTDEYESLPPKAQEYIKEGERKYFHQRYKCQIRNTWYKVPSVHSSKIGMLKRSHEAPRLILNRLEAYTTDTAYRIKSNRFSDSTLVCCFLNPLTMILSELNGRFYGGGVLELVPSEVKNLYIPIIEDFNFDIEEINRLVKNGDVENVIKHNGELILTTLGFSKEDNTKLMSIWNKLKNNRLRR